MCWLLHIFFGFFGYLILISTFLDRPKLAYVWRFHQFGFSVWSFQEHPSISLSSDHWNQFTQVSNLGTSVSLGTLWGFIQRDVPRMCFLSISIIQLATSFHCCLRHLENLAKFAGWKSSKKQWRHGRIGAKFCTLFGLRYADADNVLNPAFWLKASHWSRAFCISCEWNICFCRGFSHFNHLTFLKESMKINGIQPNSTDPANLRPAAVVVSHEAFPKLTTYDLWLGRCMKARKSGLSWWYI